MGITSASAGKTVENWALISQFGGIMQAVTVYDHVVYAGIGSRLAVMNMVNPCAGYLAHPSECLGNGDAKSLKIGYHSSQS